MCFGPDKNAEGRSLYSYDLKNRRVGIVAGEAAVRFRDLRLETHLASLKCGLFQISISCLYCTPLKSHPNSLTIWGRDCTASLVGGPEASAAYQIFISRSGT
jgi:hypothetical protein